MLIRESISGYKHLDLGNIKLAFTQVCEQEIFRDVYFAASSLYYVESGSAALWSIEGETKIETGEIALIKQHSKLDIQKFKDKNGKDFRSIIFYLFPDFVTEYIKQTKEIKSQSAPITAGIIHLGKHKPLTDFCQSLLPLFENKQLSRSDIKERTFSALDYLSQHNKKLLHFLAINSKPVKIDLYEFMIHIAINNYSVNELARLTGRSLSAFKRDFYDVFGTTPHQWLLRKKVDYAEQLLTTKKLKASDIYLMLGFNELSHFSAVFKKIKGIAPSQLV
ncbi:MAG: AraC family transcriptional regulator [Flavipsychrobacter sp.]|nr:AraC family transcriptional regulator [Flavipsychrobacter sp.]